MGPIARFLVLVLALAVGAQAEPGRDDKWALLPAGPIPVPLPRDQRAVPVQYAPGSDSDFAALLGGRFSQQALRDYLLPLRRKIHQDYYRDIDDATLARGALAGDPNGKEHDLVYSAMKGMVAALRDCNPATQQCYSWVRNPAETDIYDKMMRGTIKSWGLVYGPDVAKRMTILGVFPGGPASRAGIQVGDQIVRGETEGDRMTLTLAKSRGGVQFSVNLLREELAMPDVASHLFAEKGIGYVYVQHFGRAEAGETGTADNFLFQARSLSPKSLRGLIVDLRGNPGGDLPTCMTMAAEFLPPNATVLIRREKNKPPQKWGDTSGRGGEFASSPAVAVLLDRRSASCAEIFAAAMQDHRRAAIIGESKCSFGKGVVQSIYTLRGGKFALTTEEWLRSTGKTIQGVGVCPDPGRAVDIPEEDTKAVFSRVEAQVYGESGLLYGDPMIQKAFEYFGVR